MSPISTAKSNERNSSRWTRCHDESRSRFPWIRDRSVRRIVSRMRSVAFRGLRARQTPMLRCPGYFPFLSALWNRRTSRLSHLVTLRRHPMDMITTIPPLMKRMHADRRHPTRSHTILDGIDDFQASSTSPPTHGHPCREVSSRLTKTTYRMKKKIPYTYRLSG